MALKITLNPDERMIIGGAVLTNGSGKKSDIIIENNAPVLREKDILGEKDANSPCTRIYFVIQLMYIDQDNLSIHYQSFLKLVRELLDAAPSTTDAICRISELILDGKYYQALKLAGDLTVYEREVLKHARQSTGRICKRK